MTVRITSAAGSTPVTYLEKDAAAPIVIAAEEAKAPRTGTTEKPVETAAAAPAPAQGETHLYKITRDGALDVGERSGISRSFPTACRRSPLTACRAARSMPRWKSASLAKDDYGLQQAWAEIKPLETPATDARPLYPLPEYRLDLPRRNARDAKGLTSRNLSEHPLSGKRVRITLVARDAAGQEGRSVPQDMVLPGRQLLRAAGRRRCRAAAGLCARCQPRSPGRSTSTTPS